MNVCVLEKWQIVLAVKAKFNLIAKFLFFFSELMHIRGEDIDSEDEREIKGQNKIDTWTVQWKIECHIAIEKYVISP